MAVTVYLKDAQRLSEVEYCLTNYFVAHIVPIMNAAQRELSSAQAQEIKDYGMSFSGIMRQLASASTPSLVEDSLPYLQVTGNACAMKDEDYVGVVVDRVAANQDMQDDFARLAAEWRNCIVKEVGRDRYDEISAQLGTDLAFAYVDYRIEQMMIDKMVHDRMPKSTAEYILRKGAENSLFGLPQLMMKTPLQAQIDAEGEAAFNPSKAARLGARGVSFAADAVSMGGVYSWGALGKLAGMEVVFAGMETYLDKKMPKEQGLTVEQCISQALWGTTANVFTAVRKDNWKIKTYESDFIKSLDQSLTKRLSIFTEKPAWEIDLDWNNPLQSNSWSNWNANAFSLSSFTPENKGEKAKEPVQDVDFTGVPLFIAPEYVDEYRKWREENPLPKTDYTMTQQSVSEDNNEVQSVEQPQEQTPEQAVVESQPVEDNTNNSGWSTLLQSFGLDGITDLGRNLPYVIATLPDMLVGLLTGKTESVSLKSDMIPMASILLGMFIKNPILKLALIGLGGANLFNKMAHESLDRQAPQQPKVQYKQYADEVLNPRVADPVLKGNVLIATIDGVPCSVNIPENAIKAYESGALPLNTLVNAILERHDRMKEAAMENYRNVEIEQTLHRDRGVGLR